MAATSTWVAVTPGALEPPLAALPDVVDVEAAVVVVVVVAGDADDEHPAATTATAANDAAGTTQFPRRPRISSFLLAPDPPHRTWTGSSSPPVNGRPPGLFVWSGH
jgi:hypothetical protein